MTLFQYRRDCQVQIKGHVSDVTANGIEFHVNEQLKCFGSPLLNEDYNVVGIHTGIGTDEKSKRIYSMDTK